MPSKQFPLTGVGDITISKRRANRSIRLSVKSDGKILVTIPAWATYSSGLRFAQSKLDWIKQQLPQQTFLKDGQPVGKQHHLQLSPTQGALTIKTLVTKMSVIVRFPPDLSPESEAVQTAGRAACIRALRNEATLLLPPRLEQLATQHDFRFNEVRIKRLKGRWGSCDNKQRIVLNLFLMQLPWDCIDYVLLHELTHTQILQHGPIFWDAMQKVVPNLASIRKQMRSYQPVLY